jgi:hypothetical protein
MMVTRSVYIIILLKQQICPYIRKVINPEKKYKDHKTFLKNLREYYLLHARYEI